MDTEVLVIGGGAAGLAAATWLRTRTPAPRVTLVDRSPFNTYRPWFMYVLPHLMPPEDLRIPLAEMAERYGFTFRQASIDKLDPGSATALADGEPIRYQRVIIASGAPTDRDALPGAASHALFPCDVAGFAEFQRRLDALDAGTVSVVVTGERIGPGLEDAAWLARTYQRQDRPAVRVRLIGDGDCLVEQFGAGPMRRIRQRLEAWGAEVVQGARVQAIAADHVALADGRTLPSTLTAVVGPLRGPDLQTSRLTDDRGFFVVSPQLQSRREPGVFVAGDAVAHGSVRLRRNWQLSVRQARVAAENAVRSMSDRPLVAFDSSRDRRMTRFSLPDVGGSAYLTLNGRLLTSRSAARRVRVGFDRKHFAAYLPEDKRWQHIPE
jgi:NADH dehydrogenase FAD-containing subunit